MAVRARHPIYRVGLFACGFASFDRGRFVKILYFAWVRERVGKAEEDLTPPRNVSTVTELMNWLAERGEEYAHAFENPKIIRVAIDRAHARPDATIADAREIAFFPPMTGG